MRLLRTICFVLALWEGSAIAGDEVPAEARAAWAAMSEVPSLEARFRQVRTTRLLAKPLHATGLLRFQRPDRLAWILESPGRSVLVMRGTTVGLSYPDLGVRQEMDLKDDPEMERLARGMMVWLAGDLDAVTRDYTIAWQASEEGDVALLTPRSEALTGLIRDIALTIEGVPPQVSRVVLREPDGDTVEIELYDMHPGVPLTEAHFRLPEGTR